MNASRIAALIVVIITLAFFVWLSSLYVYSIFHGPEPPTHDPEFTAEQLNRLKEMESKTKEMLTQYGTTTEPR